MRKYKSKFFLALQEQCELDPSVTSFVNFGRTVQGMNWKENKIKRLFSTYVGLNSYPEFTLEEIGNHFVQISSRKREVI